MLGDTVRKGHKVDLLPPPAIPFAPVDWLPDGLPSTDVFRDRFQLPASARPGGVLVVLAAPLWCPVPAPGLRPTQLTLEWAQPPAGVAAASTAAAQQPAQLTLRSVNMGVVLKHLTRIDTETITVEPKPRPKKKKGKGGSSPTGRSRPTTARK